MVVMAFSLHTGIGGVGVVLVNQSLPVLFLFVCLCFVLFKLRAYTDSTS